MSESRKELFRLAAMNLGIFSLDMAFVWLAMWLAWDITVKNWWWLIGIGLLGRWLFHSAQGTYRLGREQRLRRRAGSALAFNTPGIEVSLRDAKRLFMLFGGEESRITLLYGDGHTGKGLYAFFTEYPEEGAVLITSPIDRKRDG